MSSDFFNHNGASIKDERGCKTCAFGALDNKEEPCVTCYRTHTKEFPFSEWLVNPNIDSDDGETSTSSSGMLPREQTIGQISASEAVNTLKTYLQKDDLDFWHEMILQLIIELQKLQEDKLLPAPPSDMTITELNNWFRYLQLYIQKQILQREQQLENQAHNRFERVDMVAVDSITAYASQIARQYRDYAQKIHTTDPNKARALRLICDEKLNKVSNAKEITLPDPSAELGEIEAALEQQGIAGGRKR